METKRRRVSAPAPTFFASLRDPFCFHEVRGLVLRLERNGFRIEWRSVEIVVLILVVAVVVLLLTRGGRYLGRLIVNGIVGLVLLFLTNLVLADDIPINLLTVLICAIGGALGWLIILVLHLLGIAFYVPA